MLFSSLRSTQFISKMQPRLQKLAKPQWLNRSSGHQCKTLTHTHAPLRIHFQSMGILADPLLASHASLLSHVTKQFLASCSLAVQYFLFTLFEKALTETIVSIPADLSSSTKMACIAAARPSSNTTCMHCCCAATKHANCMHCIAAAVH